jgi:hypothetical protein
MERIEKAEVLAKELTQIKTKPATSRSKSPRKTIAKVTPQALIS